VDANRAGHCSLYIWQRITGTVDMMGEPIVWPFWYGLCTGRRNLVRTWFLLSLQLTNLPIWNFNIVWSHDCWRSVSVYGHTVSVRYRYGRNPYLYQWVQFFVWWTAVIYAVITVYGYGGQPQMRMTYQLIASCRSGAARHKWVGERSPKPKMNVLTRSMIPPLPDCS